MLLERDEADRFGPGRRRHRFEHLGKPDIEILRDGRTSIEKIFVAAQIKRLRKAIRCEKELLVLLRQGRFALDDEGTGILEDEIVFVLQHALIDRDGILRAALVVEKGRSILRPSNPPRALTSFSQLVGPFSGLVAIGEGACRWRIDADSERWRSIFRQRRQLPEGNEEGSGERSDADDPIKSHGIGPCMVAARLVGRAKPSRSIPRNAPAASRDQFRG